MARPPIDPRLWRYARSARRYLTLSVVLSLVITGCIVLTAVALGRVLAGVVTDPARRSLGAWTAELAVLVLAIAGRVLATWIQSRLAHRAGAGVVAELESAVLDAGARLPARELDTRRTELAVVVGTGLSGLRGYLTGYLPALLLAALVPPIVLVVIAAHDPMSGLIVLLTLPLIPVFMILIGLLTRGRAEATLAATTRLSDQLLDLFAGMPTLRALGRETVDDSPNSRSMGHRVHELGDALRHRTMRALRVAFLSSMVLEMLATLSVALVAVSIGLRLVFGEMSLYSGLVALVLAPEVYLPLRLVGERFHAAQDGTAAAEKAFAILESVPPPTPLGERVAAEGGGIVGRHPSVPLRAARASTDADEAERCASTAFDGHSDRDSDGAGVIELSPSRGGELATRSPEDSGGEESGSPTPSGERGARASGGGAGIARHSSTVLGGQTTGVSTTRDDRAARAVAGVVELHHLSVSARGAMAPEDLSAVLRPGAVTVLGGPNGSGKSTAVLAILGLVAPERGSVTVDGVDVADLDPDRWWARVAWLPQRPVLVPGTLRENLELFGAVAETMGGHGPAGIQDGLEAACVATGFDTVLAELPERWDTLVGPGGVGLSLGQRQRLALTRVLAADRPILLLDEPTAHLDTVSEATVLAALKQRARAGATVIVVGHRPTVLAAADHVVAVRASTLSEVGS